MQGELKTAVIFDMDGVLIDSEPSWQQAEVEIFGAVKVPLTLEMCRQTTGLRMDAAVAYWFDRYPWTGASQKDIEIAVKERVCSLILRSGAAKEGAVELVQELFELGVPLAICSSSPLFIIEAVCQRLNIKLNFKVLQTAEECVFGKPHPEAYLLTANRLGIDPQKCVVIEDSVTGAISAKAARMKVLAVPDSSEKFRSRFDFCDSCFGSLAQVDAQTVLRMVAI